MVHFARSFAAPFSASSGASGRSINRTKSVSFNASLLVMMGIFWATYWILRVYFFRPMMALLDDRRSRVETAQALYEESQAQTHKRLEEERGRLSEARSEAMASRDKERREAQSRSKFFRFTISSRQPGQRPAGVHRAWSSLDF